MNILLTGALHVGKSTLIDRALALYPDWRVAGFRTIATRDETPDAIGGVHMLAVGQSPAECMPANRVGIRWRSKPPEGFPAVFDALGERLLASSNADLLLMDELGFLERDAHRFQAAVQRALDGSTPVLGVIRAQSTPFLDAIRARDDVLLLTVTVENRDSLLPLLKKTLTD